jgi:hypothetical protein
MADRRLNPTKIDASDKLTKALVSQNSPVSAAYWEYQEERGGWVFFLIAPSEAEGFTLVRDAATFLVEAPYRNVFSLSDVIIDARQIDRAKALANYLNQRAIFGTQVSTTFTGGHYFEEIIVVYFSPALTSAPAYQI